jgi:helicase
MEGVYKFIDNTFYAYQSDVSTLNSEIDDAIGFLEKSGFIKRVNNDKFVSSLFGNRTSSLYVDPMSALLLRKALEKSNNRNASSLSFLHAVCATPDVRSLFLRSSDTWVEEKAEKNKGELLIEPPGYSDEEYEWFLSDIKTASLIEDWIGEIQEDLILKKYNVGPGDIYNLVESARWLLYATREFARMYNFDCVSDINDLILRVQYGCKKEVLNLVTLKNIGRVRARSLYKEGFKTINDLRGVPIKRISKIRTIGEGIARDIKKQIGESPIELDKDLSEFPKG